MADYDAIIIGAGHNGLTAAAELAKGGMKVVVLEKTNFPGGMAATKEIFKGYKHSVGAWAFLVFRQRMIEILELEKYGLELLRPPTSYCVFGAPEDAPFIAYRDPNQMAEHLMKDHGIDAMTGLANMAAYIEPFKLMMDVESFKKPTPMSELIANAPDAKTREVLIRLNTASAMDVLRQFFPEPGKHNTILGSLCASAIDGTHMGPFTPGSALSLAYHYCAGDAYDFKIPKGGIGALSYALESCAEDRGAEIRYKSQVSRFIIEGGRATGVELRGGEKITANAVLSSLDARTTFAGLVGEEHLPEQFNHAVREIQYTNGYLQLHMTLDELPEFEGHLAFTNKNDVRWLMAYIPSAEHLSRCWDEYRNNQVPEDPVAYCYFPSL
ncbi:MAG: NAD(P)/FAD-dependent oxidoreductase, partial [Deltaproteobacteria bacterium]|nr:NAD(P)/FAD-dependent oxidoreductase [Deltaproteobacteria bacterium]